VVEMQTSYRKLAVIIFYSSAVLGFMLGAALIWANLEASLFDITVASQADMRLKSLVCPPVISASETGVISASITNSDDKDRMFTVRSNITNGFLLLRHENREQRVVSAGATETWQWNITSDDAVWNSLVLVRVFVSRSYTIPARTASCGVVVIPTKLVTGTQFIILVGSISLIGMISSLTWWMLLGDTTKGQNYLSKIAMILSVVLVVGIVFAGYLRYWLPGAILLVVCLLLLISIAGSYMQRSD